MIRRLGEGEIELTIVLAYELTDRQGGHIGTGGSDARKSMEIQTSIKTMEINEKHHET